MAERASASKSKGKKKKTEKQTEIVDLAKARKAANKKKDDNGAIGHNSGKPAPELVRKHNEVIENADKAFQSAKGRLQNAWSSAKDAGLNIAALKRARKEDAKDHGQVVIDYADTGYYLDAIGSQLGPKQFNLFSEMDSPPAEVSNALMGLNAGKHGKARDENPHTPGTADFAVWDENYLRGQEQLASGTKH